MGKRKRTGGIIHEIEVAESGKLIFNTLAGDSSRVSEVGPCRKGCTHCEAVPENAWEKRRRLNKAKKESNSLEKIFGAANSVYQSVQSTTDAPDAPAHAEPVNDAVAYEHIFEAARLNTVISSLSVTAADLCANLHTQVANVLEGKSSPSALQQVRDAVSRIQAKLEAEETDTQREGMREVALSETLQAETPPQLEASSSDSDSSSESDSSSDSEDGDEKTDLATTTKPHVESRPDPSSSDSESSDYESSSDSGNEGDGSEPMEISSDSSSSDSDSSNEDSSSGEDDEQAPAKAKPHPKIVELDGTNRPPKPNIQPPKPKDHIRVALLRERLRDFMPKMEQSKLEMERRRTAGTLNSLNVENVDGEERVIEMNLGLGVLEEKQPASNAMDGIFLKEDQRRKEKPLNWTNWEKISARLWPTKDKTKRVGIEEIGEPRVEDVSKSTETAGGSVTVSEVVDTLH